MKLETGTPPSQGRYLVYVRCASRQIPDWLEAKLGTWHNGRWDLGVPVYAWLGPLPTMKVSDATRMDIERIEAIRRAKQDFDL